jgi:Fe2+ transport system protein FeoA
VVAIGVKDPKLARQLFQLGVAPGSVLNVIRNDPPYIIFRVNEREVVVDDAVSEKIMAVVHETYGS